MRVLILFLLFASGAVHAQTTIGFARFFGVCEAEYGSSTDTDHAKGECGIITTLVNRFNATNGRGFKVQAQPIEHGSYYSQLGARIVGRDLPTLAILHASALNDFAKRRLLTPLDAGFAEVGIDASTFTAHARRGITAGGKIYAYPLDTHAWLWHMNARLLGAAGLLDAKGEPLQPRSPEEWLSHARRFKAATGKPYLIWMTANDPQAWSRTLMTLVAQQGGHLVGDDPTRVDLHSPQARRALAVLKKLYDEGLTTRHFDYSAAVQAFMTGQGGVMINGTWLIDTLQQIARTPGSALQGAYRAAPFAPVFGHEAAWADGHVIVMLEGGAKTPAQREAALRFMKFLYDEGGVWARTGQLPTREAVLSSNDFRSLPFRPEIAPLAEHGVQLPIGVARQERVLTLVGDATSAIVTGGANEDEVIARTELTINRLLQRDQKFLRGLTH